jgi:hypothetical protein
MHTEAIYFYSNFLKGLRKEVGYEITIVSVYALNANFEPSDRFTKGTWWYER